MIQNNPVSGGGSAPWSQNEVQSPVKWLLVCDEPTGASAGGEWAYCWSGYPTVPGVHSLLEYAEDNAERLRRRYLAWVHDLGETIIGGQRLIDRLRLHDGLSHWWMTLLVEKSLYKSGLSDAIRLLALDEIVRTLRPGAIRLVSTQPALHEAIRGMCERLGLQFCGEFGSVAKKGDTPRWWRRLPRTFQALGYLVRHFWRQGSLRGAGPGDWAKGDEGVFLCSYFFHFPAHRAESGVFESGYWTSLPATIYQLGKRANWLQIFYRNDSVPDARTGQSLIDALNQKAGASGRHRFLDAYLTWSMGWLVAWRWLCLSVHSLRLGGIESAFRPRDADVSFWPLLHLDWLDSLRGVSSIQNLLFQALFDRAMRDIPTQRIGFYLCENQAWERAMIHAWRKHGHGKLIGVAHATLRFWDLRYFHDPRTVNDLQQGAMPQPDFLALNGEAAFKACRDAKYPEARLVACEALRYNYLHKLRGSRECNSGILGRLRVLILGDYLKSSTERMLKMLEKGSGSVAESVAYTVKPHPNLAVRPGDYPALSLQVSSRPLAELLPDFDVAYSSNLTSASVDAYCSGLRVVVMLDDSELNFSPLRGWPGVRFVSNPETLAKALVDKSPHGTHAAAPDYFYLDPELPRWSALLSV